jgi:hypothetical protein
MYDQLLAISEAAREYIAQGWTQHDLARYSDGQMCHPSDPEAASFCMIGAIWAGFALLSDSHLSYRGLIDRINRLIPTDVVVWNDNPRRTKEEVLAVFDVLIDELRDTIAEPAGDVSATPRG